MTEQTVNHYEDDEISLLDILVTLAESWKLLVFGPLLAGVLAGALSFLWPKTFESTAILRLTESEVALLNSSPVLDPLIERLGLLAEFDGVQDDARKYLQKKIVGTYDKKNNLATITATARTSDRAQEIVRLTIDALLIELLPKGKNKDQIEQKINNNEKIISSDRDALDQLQKQMSKSVAGDAVLEVVMKYYAALTAEVASKELENIELRKSLLVKGDEVYVQKASLPQRQVAPKLSLVIILALLVSLFLLFIFVIVRKILLDAMNNDKTKEKFNMIKKSIVG